MAEMVDSMKKVVELLDRDLDMEERNLLSVSYKNYVSQVSRSDSRGVKLTPELASKSLEDLSSDRDIRAQHRTGIRCRQGLEAQSRAGHQSSLSRDY